MRQGTSALGLFSCCNTALLKKCRTLNIFGLLILAAALTLSTAGTAAAWEINTNSSWDAANSSGHITLTGGGSYPIVTTTSANTALPGLSITGDATLNMNHDLGFSSGSRLTGNSGTELSILNIASGTTLGGALTLNSNSQLNLSGKIEGLATITGENAHLKTTGTSASMRNLFIHNGSFKVQGDTTIDGTLFMLADGPSSERTNVVVDAGATLTIYNSLYNPGFSGGRRISPNLFYPANNVVDINGTVVSGISSRAPFEFMPVDASIHSGGALVATDVLVSGGFLNVAPATTVDGVGAQANIYKSLTVQNAAATFASLTTSSNGVIHLGNDSAAGKLQLANGGSATFQSGSTLAVNAKSMNAGDVAVFGGSGA